VQSRSAEIAATVADPAPVLQLIVVSAVEILQGAAGVIALLEGDRLVPRASYGLPSGALTSLHPRLDRAILNVLGQLGEQVSVLYLPSGFGDWARRYHVLALPMQQHEQLLGVIYVFRYVDAGGFSDRDLHVLDVFARQAAGALQQARATADMLAEKTRLEEMQNTFVSIVSHELQTPVAIIKSYAATLAREDAVWPAETIQRVSHNIEDECDRLTRLITDLLDLSRIQAGRVAMRVGSVDLPQIASEIIDQLSPRAPHHSLRSSFPPNFPIVRGDADQLRRALFNLLQNAIKYSPGGGEVLVAGELAGPSAVAVRVIDQGSGIAPGEEERIFERFHRSDNRLSRATAGVGLGLYITRSIVEGHGGRIWAESPGPGKGSTFTIVLPIGEAP
jgi:signal transduction histidine kinase